MTTTFKFRPLLDNLQIELNITSLYRICRMTNFALSGLFGIRVLPDIKARYPVSSQKIKSKTTLLSTPPPIFWQYFLLPYLSFILPRYSLLLAKINTRRLCVCEEQLPPSLVHRGIGKYKSRPIVSFFFAAENIMTAMGDI